jgi:hypothetical protein
MSNIFNGTGGMGGVMKMNMNMGINMGRGTGTAGEAAAGLWRVRAYRACRGRRGRWIDKERGGGAKDDIP